MDLHEVAAGLSPDNFWHRAKNELIEILLKDSVKKSDVSILSIGAGTGEELTVLNKFGTVSVIDIESEALKRIPDDLCKTKFVADATKLPFPKDSFDVVVAFDVLEHIPNDKRVVKEVFRVLKKGGCFVLTVPAMSWLFSPYDSFVNHVRRYDYRMLRKLLGNNAEIGFWNFCLFAPFALERLVRRKKGGYGNLPKLLNSFFFGILRLENLLIKQGLRFPWGLSLWAVARKGL